MRVGRRVWSTVRRIARARPLSLGGISTLVVVGALLGTAPTVGRSPAPSTAPAPNATPGPGGLVPGVLPWAPIKPPALRDDRWLGPLVAWAGGFATVEHKRQPHRREYRSRAVWHSSDGRSWTRSSLPRRATDVHDLLPFRDGLLLVTDKERRLRRHGFALAFWRSPDGVSWRRTGELAYQVSARLEARTCQANRQQVTTIGDRITVYVSVCWGPCCGSSPIASGSDTTVGLATWVSGQVTPRGVAAWSSTDGKRWRRQPLQGMAPPGTEDYGIEIRQQPDELVAIRLAREPALLRSADGITWTTYAEAPPSFDHQGGTLDIASVPDALLLLGEAFDSPPGFGNELIIWRITPTKTTQVFTRRAAVGNSIVVDGPRVLVSGRSWSEGPDGYAGTGDEEAWGWLIASDDGGATWPEPSSWTGGDGSCLGEMAMHGGMVVALACVNDRTTVPPSHAAVWGAAVDDTWVAPTRPSPTGPLVAASPQVSQGQAHAARRTVRG